MAIERHQIRTREEWLAWRRQDVTASTVAALFGKHPYTTALKLYVEKRGTEFVEADNSVLRRGRWLENCFPAVISEKRPDWTLVPATVYLRDPEHRIGATPDFFILGDPRGRGILQAKSVAPSVFEREWDGGREPPLWIILQAATEAMLEEAAFAAVAALVVDPFNMDCEIIEVPRKPAAERKIIEAADKFWADVAAGREPEPDYGKDTETIRALTARVTAGKTFDGSGHNELPMLLAQRAALVARIKADEERCTEIENEIKLLMNDAEVITGLNGWRVTYKMVDRQAYSVAAKSSRQLRILDRRPAHERPDAGEDA